MYRVFRVQRCWQVPNDCNVGLIRCRIQGFSSCLLLSKNIIFNWKINSWNCNPCQKCKQLKTCRHKYRCFYVYKSFTDILSLEISADEIKLTRKRKHYLINFMHMFLSSWYNPCLVFCSIKDGIQFYKVLVVDNKEC